MSETATKQDLGDLTWRQKIVAQQVEGLPKERGQTYYYSDGLGGRRQMWLKHTPGVNIPLRVESVLDPGTLDDDPDSFLKMNIGTEKNAYRLYKALEAYFADERSRPYFLQDTEADSQ